MSFRFPKIPIKWIWMSTVVAIAVASWVTSRHWLPPAKGWANQTIDAFRSAGVSSNDTDGETPTVHPTEPHAGHAHPQTGHNETTSLELSPQALRNVGLSADQIRPVTLQNFRKSITVPAVVVERPARTSVQVATPMTGVITHVHAVQGEAVDPGTLLFKIRLTHEDLVQAQTSFLTSLGELDVEQREIKRLTEITKSGAVAGKVLLDRQYAKDKLTALISAQREALRLHGLSDQQVDQIDHGRRLLRELHVFAPSIDTHDEDSDELRLSRNPVRPVGFNATTDDDHESHATFTGPLILQQLNVHKGQSVNAGETLCILADYGELFIEGLAFEQDVSQLRRASEQGWSVEAVFDHAGIGSRIVDGLEIAYLANRIDTVSRTLNFYVRLPNEITKDRRANGNRFVEWKYLPGQRLQLRVPVEEWPDQIVLPVDAVASEGAEYFVFQQNGDHFDRVAIHVKYKDQHSAVVENDGSLFPGDVIAMRGAHQLQMALKNKSGGGVDPHAGHTH